MTNLDSRQISDNLVRRYLDTNACNSGIMQIGPRVYDVWRVNNVICWSCREGATGEAFEQNFQSGTDARNKNNWGFM